MKIANVQESRLLDNILSTIKLPNINFRTYSYDEYIAKRERTKLGFIGYQVPRNGIDRTYRNDFAIYIPNKIDYRIECKSLDVSGTLSRAVITEEMLIADTMPEKNLILFVEGKGFESLEFLETINKTMNSNTFIMDSMSSFLEYLNNIF